MSGIPACEPVRVDERESHGGAVDGVGGRLVCGLAREAVCLREEKGQVERLGFGGARFLGDGTAGVDAGAMSGGRVGRGARRRVGVGKSRGGVKAGVGGCRGGVRWVVALAKDRCERDREGPGRGVGGCVEGRRGGVCCVVVSCQPFGEGFVSSL